MTLTESKEYIYKHNPSAYFLHLRKTGKEAILVYGSLFSSSHGHPKIFFEIPVSELADGRFEKRIEAQLLIRYIVQPETTQP